MTDLFTQCLDPVVTMAISLPLHSLVVLLLQSLELCFQVDHLCYRHLVLTLQDLEPMDIWITATIGRWRRGVSVGLLALLRVIELFVSIETFQGTDALREAVDPLTLLGQGALCVLQLGLRLLQVHEQRRLLPLHLQDGRIR